LDRAYRRQGIKAGKAWLNQTWLNRAWTRELLEASRKSRKAEKQMEIIYYAMDVWLDFHLIHPVPA
jgi:hypothetical protein